jgi:hypothetical protein
MSSIAVFLVLGGATAFAAGLAKNSVGSKQLKKNAVTSAKVKANAVTTAKIKNGAVTGAKLNVGSIPTVPSATSATSAGNANTVGGQSVVKLFKTLTAGQSEVPVGSAGGFSFFATCESGDVNVKAVSPLGPGWVMQSGGTAGDSENPIEEYESEPPGSQDFIFIDELYGTGDASYGVTSFYGATTTGTAVSGTIGFDYDTFGDDPENVCIVTGHLTVG